MKDVSAIFSANRYKSSQKDEKVILRGDLAVILVTYNRLLFRAIAKSMACKCLFQATSLSAYATLGEKKPRLCAVSSILPTYNLSALSFR